MGLRPAVALLLAIIMSRALAGCYLPIRFDAEIEITRNGYYEIFFDGYVAEVTLFDALRQRSLAPGEEQTRADHVIEDSRRDSATEEALYVKPGIFKINWRKSGDLLRARMITFFHRNENMLSVKYVKTTRLITVQATPIGKENARKLGLDPESVLRHGNAKFERRFRAMETLAVRQGRQLEVLGLERMEALWQSAKTDEEAATRPQTLEK